MPDDLTYIAATPPTGYEFTGEFVSVETVDAEWWLSQHGELRGKPLGSESCVGTRRLILRPEGGA
jgi:hypothetical protein